MSYEGYTLGLFPLNDVEHCDMTTTNPMQGRSSDGAGPGLSAQYRTAIGQYIKGLRLDAGLTQKQLGALMNLDDASISFIENGAQSLPPERYRQLVKVFNLEPEDFGKFLLRYTNVWLYELLFGTDDDPSVRRDIKRMPARINKTDPKRKPNGRP